jgi:hypothetical protein
MNTKTDLANFIMEMNYGELKKVAVDLAGMKDADVRPKIETPEEYAEMLFDWAEANAALDE